MKIGIVDVDGHNYPNLALMKISAYHKRRGDIVEWHDPLFGGHYDKVYLSKVFSFTPDYEYYIDADEIERGGSGYCITTVNGREIYDKTKDKPLPYEVEHIYPDYTLYPELTKETAYGYMTRGCPRQCDFCIVKDKCGDGTTSRKVADLTEFWNGQKHIELLDPNTLAAKEWRDVLGQLIESGARVNFNQGLDIRMMTREKAEMLARIPIDNIHFAWDRIQDKKMILPKFEAFRESSKIHASKLQVYVLVGFDTTIEQDLERIYTLRDMGGYRKGFYPYVMIYDKAGLPKSDIRRSLQRWVNNRIIFGAVDTFDEYLKQEGIKWKNL